MCCLQHVVDQELIISIRRLLKYFLFIDVCCIFARADNFYHQLLFEKNTKRRIILCTPKMCTKSFNAGYSSLNKEQTLHFIHIFSVYNITLKRNYWVQLCDGFIETNELHELISPDQMVTLIWQLWRDIFKFIISFLIYVQAIDKSRIG